MPDIFFQAAERRAGRPERRSFTAGRSAWALIAPRRRSI